MSKTIRRHPARHVIAAAALTVPSVVFAAPPQTAAAIEQAPVTRTAIESASPHDPGTPVKGALLRAVVESLAVHSQQEASPFEPPGKPPARPPDNPGHHDPPNPPGQPGDRPDH